MKSLVLQEQHINHYGWKLLSAVEQDGDKWINSDWTLSLTDRFMIQFDINYLKFIIKEFDVVDGEVLDQLLKPNIPRNKGFNNSWNRVEPNALYVFQVFIDT